MSYWTDIFTLETWAQAEQHGWSVSGFPAPTKKRGGYSDRMFGRIRVGDVLLCYCKRPAARWVGALKINGAMYIDDEPIWGLAEDGTVRFPARFEVEPLVVLDPARGVPGPEAAKALTCLSRLKRWGTFLQRSLNEVPDADGERLLAMLREPRPEAPITVPQRRARRTPAAEAPERGHLEAQAQPPTLASIDGGERTEDELRSRAPIARSKPSFVTSGSTRATTCGWPIGASSGTTRSWVKAAWPTCRSLPRAERAQL